jgi:hypothetical protein
MMTRASLLAPSHTHNRTHKNNDANKQTTETQHTFSATETDWGFTQFLPLSDVTPERGYVGADDAVTLRATIRVQRDERYSYDSRAETGHVGLKNQGATCYMNSLLQYLFHVPALRKAVYHMPTAESDEPGSCMPLALQVCGFVLCCVLGVCWVFVCLCGLLCVCLCMVGVGGQLVGFCVCVGGVICAAPVLSLCWA